MRPTAANVHMRVRLAPLLALTLLACGCVPARVEPSGAIQPLVAATPAAQPSAGQGGPRAPRRNRRPAATPAPHATPAPAAPPATRDAAGAVVQSSAALDGFIDDLQPPADADYAIVVEDLGSGARAALNEDSVFASASLYKLGLAWLALRRADAGALNLDAPLEITPEDAVEGEPNGGIAPGSDPPLRDALEAMLSLSSNNVAHALLRAIGREDFNAEMQRIGLTQTRVPTDAEDEASSGEATAVTSAADMARLLRFLATNTEQLSPASREELKHALADTAPPDALRDTLGNDVTILDKTGNLEDASNVAALLQTARGMVVLVVLDRGVDPGDARGVIAEAGQLAYERLLQPHPAPMAAPN